MITVMKKKGNIIRACRLGFPSPVLDQLIKNGKIISLPDGSFEVMSREAAAGGTGRGQAARRGDYIKQDSDGFPYPNTADFFESNHTQITEDLYEQHPLPLKAWTLEEPMCPEIEFLMDRKGLVINKADYAKTFTAPLWGTVESAPGDAVILFYSISYDEAGTVIDADYNFVIRQEFEKNYRLVPGED